MAVAGVEEDPNLKPSAEPPNLNPDGPVVSLGVVSDEELPNAAPNLNPADDDEDSETEAPNLNPPDPEVESDEEPNLKPPEPEVELPNAEEPDVPKVDDPKAE